MTFDNKPHNPCCGGVGYFLVEGKFYVQTTNTKNNLRVLANNNVRCIHCNALFGIRQYAISSTELAEESDRQFAIFDAECITGVIKT